MLSFFQYADNAQIYLPFYLILITQPRPWISVCQLRDNRNNKLKLNSDRVGILFFEYVTT